MKNRTTATPRAAASRGASTNGNGTSAKTAALAPEPSVSAPPPPAPVLSHHRRFMDRVTAILNGSFTPNEQLYRPLIDADPNKVTVLGTVQSMQARNLFSLHLELHGQSLQLPYPHNGEEAEAYKRDTITLRELSDQAEKLAWTFVHDEFPGQAERNDLALCDDWVLVRKPDYEDAVRKQAEERFSSAEESEAQEFIAGRLQRRKEEERASEKVDPFAERERRTSKNDPRRELLGLLSGLEAIAGLDHRGGFGM